MMTQRPLLLGDREGHQCPAGPHRLEGARTPYPAGRLPEHRGTVLGQREENLPPAAAALEETGDDQTVKRGPGCRRGDTRSVEHADEDARADRARIVIEYVFAKERQ